jgi:hypothetical protein
VNSLTVQAAWVPGAISRLDALAAELADRGWAAQLEMPPRRLPRLHVHNSAAPAFSEYVYAQPRRDGTWTYWWPWAQPIAAATTEAATIIIGAMHATDS